MREYWDIDSSETLARFAVALYGRAPSLLATKLYPTVTLSARTVGQKFIAMKMPKATTAKVRIRSDDESLIRILRPRPLPRRIAPRCLAVPDHGPGARRGLSPCAPG